jgi:hypothetical protein
LEESPLQYCSTRDNIAVLRSGQLIPAPNLRFSARSGWRRAVSPIWNPGPLERHSTSRVVRTSLHPKDLHDPKIKTLWRLLPSQLDDRSIVTEAQLIPPQFTRSTISPERLRLRA